MRNIFFIVTMFLVFGIVSCNKSDNGGSFILKGRWLKDCSDIPVAHEPIHIIMYTYNGMNSKKKYEAGNGVTDSLGNFSVVCENHGNCEITFDNQSVSPVTEIPGGKDKIFDMGNIYSQHTMYGILKIVFNTAHSDTFYIGKSEYSIFGKIFPANGTQYLPITKEGGPYKPYNQSQNVFFYPSDMKYFYGFGFENYRQKFYSGANTLLFTDNVYSSCTTNDTTIMLIP